MSRGTLSRFFGCAFSKLESERGAIQAELNEKDTEILNLNDCITFTLGLMCNVLKLWQLANLGQKRRILNLAFPDGLVWSKENDDIEPMALGRSNVNNNSFPFRVTDNLRLST